MSVETLDDSNFEATLAQTEFAIVDFYAGWCGPCRLFAPKFRRMAESIPQVRFFKLDGEHAPLARKSVTIENLPYFGVYRNGEFIAGLSTSQEDAVRTLIATHLGIGETATSDAPGAPNEVAP